MVSPQNGDTLGCPLPDDATDRSIMLLWTSSNSCPLNLLLVESHQAEMIIVKRLIQERNSVTRVRVEPLLCDQVRHNSDGFASHVKISSESTSDRLK